jgi:hypothetical protein
LLLVLTAISDDGVEILMLLMIVATVWILLVWRREIQLRSVIQGFELALIANLGGLPFLNNGFVGETTFYGLLILVPPMYIAGGLLVDRTGLGGVQLLAKRYRQLDQLFLGLSAVRSFGSIQCRRWFTRPEHHLGERVVDAFLTPLVLSHNRRNMVQIITCRTVLFLVASSLSKTPSPANSCCCPFQRDHVWPGSLV